MMNKDQAIKNLVDVQRVFPNGFLAYGSALGAHRDKDIISHDLDTDFGVFDEDFNFSGINELVKKGFEIKLMFGMRHHGLEIALKRGGVKTDVMIIYKGQDKYWNCLWDNGGKNGMSDQIVHEYLPGVFIERSIVKIKGHPFHYYGKRYIEAVYGKEWNKEVKEWNWRTDHKCLKKYE